MIGLKNSTLFIFFWRQISLLVMSDVNTNHVEQPPERIADDKDVDLERIVGNIHDSSGTS